MFPDTPQTLLRKIRELAVGDDAAEWEDFVELYTPPLTRFVQLVGNGLSHKEVEDAVQDIFVRLVEVLRGGKYDRSRGRFRAYLASMTRRLLIDRYRAALVRPQLRQEHELPAEGISICPHTAADGVDPGALLDIKWRLAVHSAAVDHVLAQAAISAQSREVYRVVCRGQSLRDAAARFGLSYAAVKQIKSRLDRAIAAVERRLLEE